MAIIINEGIMNAIVGIILEKDKFESADHSPWPPPKVLVPILGINNILSTLPILYLEGGFNSKRGWSIIGLGLLVIISVSR